MTGGDLSAITVPSAAVLSAGIICAARTAGQAITHGYSVRFTPLLTLTPPPGPGGGSRFANDSWKGRQRGKGGQFLPAQASPEPPGRP